MSRPLGYIGFEFGDDDTFVRQMMEENRNDTETEKLLDQQKKMLECTETIPEDEEPVPLKSLDFEEAFQMNHVPDGYESAYRNIPFLKEDVVTVNTMSHCSPDDIAKLIRNIQNSVYTLGLEEARQCRRGKLLNVLKPNSYTPKRRVQQSQSDTETDEVPTATDPIPKMEELTSPTVSEITDNQ